MRCRFEALTLIFILSSTSAFSATSTEPLKENSLRLDFNTGSGQYSQSILSGEFQLNPEVRLQLGAGSTRVDSVKSSGELQAGVSIHFDDNNDLNVSANVTSFADGLRSRSARVGHVVNVATLWDGFYRTDLLLEIQTALYLEQQGQTRFRQNGFTLGIDQEFLESGVVGVSWTQYAFTERDTNIQSAIQYFQSFEASPVLRAFSGLLTRTQTFHVGYGVHRNHFLDLSLGKSIPVDPALEFSTFSSLRWDWTITSRWNFALEGTTNRVGSQAVSSGGLSFRFRF